VLVDPSNPLTSPAKTYTLKDVNKSKAPTCASRCAGSRFDKVDVTIAYNRSRIDGFGPNFDSPEYKGGADPLLPATIYPATGEYEVVQRGLQPFKRKSDMVTGDVSIDLGFATLSSTTSYFETTGATFYDGTWGRSACRQPICPITPALRAYPRFQSLQRYNDNVKAFTQEVRLVSMDGPIDYIVGAYYQHERNYAEWSSFDPGQIALQQPAGRDGTGLQPAAGRPDLDERGHVHLPRSRAVRRSHMACHAAARYPRAVPACSSRASHAMRETCRRSSASTRRAKPRPTTAAPSSASTPLANTSTTSAPTSPSRKASGAARANTFTTAGFLREPESLRFYKPDTVNNFELGLKGRVAGSWRYTADVFAKWKNAQIGGFTAVNFWPAVFNAGDAESKGFELEVSGKLMPSLALSLGYSYTDAKLTKDFCLPSGDGSGRPSPDGDIACAISGAKGTRLPTAPKHSATFTFNYEQPVSEQGKVLATFNGNYKSSTFQILPTAGQRYPTIPVTGCSTVIWGTSMGPTRSRLMRRTSSTSGSSMR
jgi:outer membrane receptor protein involved in Fe transport